MEKCDICVFGTDNCQSAYLEYSVQELEDGRHQHTTDLLRTQSLKPRNISGLSMLLHSLPSPQPTSSALLYKSCSTAAASGFFRSSISILLWYSCSSIFSPLACLCTFISGSNAKRTKVATTRHSPPML
ncbi:hypothetical protein E2C01_017324 [Portunus trituberculatus]|uniref:Uncharacterized protein n=1 Tax=Portunus trituberculatus TaxID=210409 RepID=A0A5B7DTH1_PORTR|nr:hypothetical protein [Portunus trituberculatus]